MNRKQYKQKFNNTNLDILSEFRKLSNQLESLNYLISECTDDDGIEKLIVKRDSVANKLGILYPATKRIQSLQTA